ncbi:ABC transporter permease, partial [Enterovibrio norvegicus FF-162]
MSSPQNPSPSGNRLAGDQLSNETFSLVQRIQLYLHNHPTAVPCLVLILAVAFFSTLVGDRFFHPFNLSLVLQQVTIIGVIGIAQTLIILTAGIDLSVGAIMVLTSVVMGRFAIDFGLPAPVALFAGLLVGALAGLINGLLVAKIKLPPFIATLGTWNIFFALNLWYSNSQTIRSQVIDQQAPLLQWLGNTVEVFGARIAYSSLFMFVLFIVFWYALNWTAWGRHVYATGDDPDAARLAGIRTKRILLSVYITAGVVCALAAWVLIGRIGSVS